MKVAFEVFSCPKSLKELTKCPPNLPVDLKFWLHVKKDDVSMEAARLIEEVVARFGCFKVLANNL